MNRLRLDQELVRRGLARSRAEARSMIEGGRVHIQSVVTPKPATLVDASTPIDLRADAARYVGRGGEKLEAALAEFRISVEGRRALDVGASVGGFTDCLLQHGASSVTALDVGTGQLDWKLRQDARVEIADGVNVRHVEPRELGAPFDVVTVDVSFISLRAIAPALVSLGTQNTDYVLLVKPQFEAGREQVPKGGVIRDTEVHRAVLSSVVGELSLHGLGVVGVLRSPLVGAKGNIEFLAHALLGDTTVSAENLDQVIR
ncbi:MAG: TlyA family RNA methyltransferase [Acidimicrobiia bacterium]